MTVICFDRWSDKKLSCQLLDHSSDYHACSTIVLNRDAQIVTVDLCQLLVVSLSLSARVIRQWALLLSNKSRSIGFDVRRNPVVRVCLNVIKPPRPSAQATASTRNSRTCDSRRGETKARHHVLPVLRRGRWSASLSASQAATCSKPIELHAA